MYVVFVNPGDEQGFPSRPSKVHDVEPKDLAKLIATNLGSVALVVDLEREVPHLGAIGKLTTSLAQRLVNHAFMSINRVVAAKTFEIGQAVRATEQHETQRRVWQDFMELPPEERAKVKQPPERPAGV